MEIALDTMAKIGRDQNQLLVVSIRALVILFASLVYGNDWRAPLSRLGAFAKGWDSLLNRFKLCFFNEKLKISTWGRVKRCRGSRPNVWLPQQQAAAAAASRFSRNWLALYT